MSLIYEIDKEKSQVVDASATPVSKVLRLDLGQKDGVPLESYLNGDEFNNDAHDTGVYIWKDASQTNETTGNLGKTRILIDGKELSLNSISAQAIEQIFFGGEQAQPTSVGGHTVKLGIKAGGVLLPGQTVTEGGQNWCVIDLGDVVTSATLSQKQPIFTVNNWTWNLTGPKATAVAGGNNTSGLTLSKNPTDLVGGASVLKINTDNDTTYVNNQGKLVSKVAVPNVALEKDATTLEMNVRYDDRTVKVSADNKLYIPIDEDTIKVINNKVAVPIATTTQLGVVKSDGDTITIEADGTIKAAGGLTDNGRATKVEQDTTVTGTRYKVSVEVDSDDTTTDKTINVNSNDQIYVERATDTQYGVVKFDDDSIVLNADNQISATQLENGEALERRDDTDPVEKYIFDVKYDDKTIKLSDGTFPDGVEANRLYAVIGEELQFQLIDVVENFSQASGSTFTLQQTPNQVVYAKQTDGTSAPATAYTINGKDLFIDWDSIVADAGGNKTVELKYNWKKKISGRVGVLMPDGDTIREDNATGLISATQLTTESPLEINDYHLHLEYDGLNDADKGTILLNDTELYVRTAVQETYDTAGAPKDTGRLGVVIPDGDTITIDADGLISATQIEPGEALEWDDTNKYKVDVQYDDKTIKLDDTDNYLYLNKDNKTIIYDATDDLVSVKYDGYKKDKNTTTDFETIFLDDTKGLYVRSNKMPMYLDSTRDADTEIESWEKERDGQAGVVYADKLSIKTDNKGMISVNSTQFNAVTGNFVDISNTTFPTTEAVVKYVNQTHKMSVKISTSPETTPKGIQWKDATGSIITGTLEASDVDEPRQLYLVPMEDVLSGVYVQYMSIELESASGSTFEWEKLGTTAVDLKDFIHKSNKVAGIPFYNELNPGEPDDDKDITSKEIEPNLFVFTNGLERELVADTDEHYTVKVKNDDVTLKVFADEDDVIGVNFDGRNKTIADDVTILANATSGLYVRQATDTSYSDDTRETVDTQGFNGSVHADGKTIVTGANGLEVATDGYEPMLEVGMNLDGIAGEEELLVIRPSETKFAILAPTYN